MPNLPLFMVLSALLLFSLSSHKHEDYESCNTENNSNHCLKCNSDKHRYLESSPGPSKCLCNIGWFDSGIEACKIYSWEN